MVAKKQMGTDAMAQAEAVVTAGKETVEKAMKVGQEAAQKSYEQALQMTKEQVEKASKAMYMNYEEFTGLTKGNYDAYVSAVGIWTKGVEAFGKQFYAITQGSMEKSVETSKSLFACKTINEVVELQNGLAKASFDAMVSDTAKLSELSVKTTNEAIAPLQARWAETVERISKPIAA
jgi:phasin family protein